MRIAGLLPDAEQKGAIMTIAHQRLYNQSIALATFEKPGDVVQWLGAVQAQDYLGALWAIGLRMRHATEADIEQAIADKTIVRTWFMRGTVHFVPGADIRWMLQLMSPRVRMISHNILQYQRLELDDATLAKSFTVLVKALQGGKQLIRPELAAMLEQAGIATGGLRLTCILHRAQADGLICQAARRGKQFTFALLDEWLPPTRLMQHDEALAEFARRYFTSHGPATLQDFVWWSGLTVADARASLEMVKSQFMHEVVDGQTYWFSTSMPPAKDLSQTAYLLPNYDEYIVGYKDRSAMFDASHTNKLDSRGNVLFNHTIVLDGRVVGTWTRTIKKDGALITPSLFTPLNKAETRAFLASASRYGAFLGKSVNATF